MNEKSKATAISSIFFYISTNTTISPGGERRLIVSVCFSMYIEARKKKEILCQLDKHTHHIVTKLSKKKELAFHPFFFRSRQIYAHFLTKLDVDGRMPYRPF